MLLGGHSGNETGLSGCVEAEFLVYAIVAVPMFMLIWLMRRLVAPFVLYLKRREQPFWYAKFINGVDNFTELLIK